MRCNSGAAVVMHAEQHIYTMLQQDMQSGPFHTVVPLHAMEPWPYLH